MPSIPQKRAAVIVATAIVVIAVYVSAYRSMSRETFFWFLIACAAILVVAERLVKQQK